MVTDVSLFFCFPSVGGEPHAQPVHGLAGGVRARDPGGGHHAGDTHVRQPEARGLRGCDHRAPTGGGGSGCGGKKGPSDEPYGLMFLTGTMLLAEEYGPAAG